MQEQKLNTFSKAERLYGKTVIDRLFTDGKAFLSYPLRIVFHPASKEDDIPVRCLINAPKKKFKHATDRNRIKRQIRETYRTNKHQLYETVESKNYQLHLAITYIGDKIEPTDFIEKKMRTALEKLIEKLP